MLTDNRDCERAQLDYLGVMDWQQVASLLVVGTTGALFLRQKLRRRKFDFKRDTHCGCSSREPSPQKIVFTARKGERSRILVKSS